MKLPDIDPDKLVGRDLNGIPIPAGRVMRTGEIVDLIDPKPDQFTIESIASGLAYQGRFTGQTRVYYDLARHSILVSFLVAPKLAFKALLHDSAEAVVNDIARPAKPLLKDYKPLEMRILGVIFEKYGLRLPLERAIKHADEVAVAIEQKFLLPDTPFWPHIFTDVQVRDLLAELAIPRGFFMAATPELSRIHFLKRFAELNNERSRS